MDVLRGVAIFCVVVLHAVNLAAMLSGVRTPAVLEDFNAAVMPYRMPMLFVLSGMLLTRALAKSPGRYYMGKVRSLIWPYLVWVNVYWLVTSPDGIPGWDQWLGTSWLWYLFYLVVFYLVAPVLARAPVWLVPVVLWAASAAVPDPEWTLLFLYAGYFFAGHLIWACRERLRRFTSAQWTALGVVATASLSVAYVAQQHGAVFLVPLQREELLYAPLTVIGIGGLVLIARRVPLAWSRPARFLGRNSMVFYLTHFPLQILLANALGALLIWDWRVHVGLGVVLSLLVGTCLVHLRRVRAVDWLFVMPRPRRVHAESA